jgi:hypothetical protein
MAFCRVHYHRKKREGPPGVNLAGLFWGLFVFVDVFRDLVPIDVRNESVRV